MTASDPSPHRPLSLHCARIVAACCVLLGLVPPAAARATARSWQRAALAGAAADVHAVAIDPASPASAPRLAVGDARGVVIREPTGGVRRAVRRGPVRELVFAADGALWIATARGLWRLARDGRLEERSPGSGAQARDVLRIAARGRAVAAATGLGAYVGLAEGAWQRVRGLPSGAVDAVAIAERGAGVFELWFGVRGELWRAEARVVEAKLVLGTPRRERLPAVRSGQPLLDVVPARPSAGSGTGSLALTPIGLAVRSAAGEWRSLPLRLPPGSRARRLLRTEDRYWLATDRGLLVAVRAEGPWQRAAPPAGRVAVAALASRHDVVYVASAHGLLEGRDGPLVVGGEDRLALRPRPGEPDIGTVQRAALAYLGLGPERMRALRRGVDRRGYLPELDLRLGSDLEWNSSRDADQSFVSGATRRLFDHTRDQRRDFSASLTLSWDLGDTAYNPEAIDVSRETREVLELRDDILDEITQLYFERRRVLLALAALPAGRADRAAEAARLRLRADELAAGIDAWTGGWFTRHAPRLAP